ncbi:hypothetical protein JRO89_XS01G0125900 [Xanthoceras sorbifolium]|uniref:Secreted protein n=1 Tax=Xanthoceras sorbifolium TaxID=99658 RepID=A0ABQ8IJL6_9ROSI|nr:hypothetical protein JRO89_XS01G0125900 [Xanthoceras sorbifolium]
MEKFYVFVVSLLAFSSLSWRNRQSCEKTPKVRRMLQKSRHMLKSDQDNPVGTWYNYVEDADDEKFVKTDVEAATDLAALLKEILTEIRNFRRASLCTSWQSPMLKLEVVYQSSLM